VTDTKYKKYPIEIQFTPTDWVPQNFMFSDVVYIALDNAGRPMRPSELAKVIQAHYVGAKFSESAVRVSLLRMYCRGKVQRLGDTDDCLYDTDDRHTALQSLLAGFVSKEPTVWRPKCRFGRWTP
jgi:DNA-binding transcriptional regulator PaaX